MKNVQKYWENIKYKDWLWLEVEINNTSSLFTIPIESQDLKLLNLSCKCQSLDENSKSSVFL